MLKACIVESLDERLARAAGELLGSMPVAGMAGACIAVGVARRGDALATSDLGDMRALLGIGRPILSV